jgi:hypothetical protein
LRAEVLSVMDRLERFAPACPRFLALQLDAAAIVIRTAAISRDRQGAERYRNLARRTYETALKLLRRNLKFSQDERAKIVTKLAEVKAGLMGIGERF